MENFYPRLLISLFRKISLIYPYLYFVIKKNYIKNVLNKNVAYLYKQNMNNLLIFFIMKLKHIFVFDIKKINVKELLETRLKSLFIY